MLIDYRRVSKDKNRNFITSCKVSSGGSKGRLTTLVYLVLIIVLIFSLLPYIPPQLLPQLLYQLVLKLATL
jgi:hypothetical protein